MHRTLRTASLLRVRVRTFSTTRIFQNNTNTGSYQKLNMASEITKPGCKCTDKQDPVEMAENYGPLETSLREKVVVDLEPTVFIVRNDSWKHSHHSGMKGASNTIESHFNITIVSEKFNDIKGQLARHRYVFKLLDDEVKQIHGFQVTCKTPTESEKLQNAKSETSKRESSSKYF